MWQDYKTMMFSIYGTGLVDSVSGTDGRMFMTFDRTTGIRLPSPVLVTEQNFEQVVGPKNISPQKVQELD
jgi:hypothetical protein